jgi:small subunit ribosomal protein S1
MEHQDSIDKDTEVSPSPSTNLPNTPNGMMTEEDEEMFSMEQFLQDPAHDYPNFQHGDTVDGIIIRIDKDSILVDIGSKSEGIVPLREMQSLTQAERDALQVGDEQLVFVVQAEHREGYAILSIDRARQEKSWRRLQQAYEAREIISARVVNYNKGGLLVTLDGVRGFVPASQVDGISRSPETQKQSDMARLVGQDMDLKVIEINRERNRLILSERQANQEAREGKKDELLAVLNEGDIYTGTVSSVCDFGAFVDIGGADGLVHLSELSWGRVRHPADILKVGDQIRVCILSIDNERKRIALSMKRTQREPWETVSERYHLGQIVTGVITQLASFGAFARIEDGVEGLIHISEIGDERIQHPRDLVREDDTVQVRIIRIDPSRKRMGLSLRTQAEPSDAELSNGEEQPPDITEPATTDEDAPDEHRVEREESYNE